MKTRKNLASLAKKKLGLGGALLASVVFAGPASASFISFLGEIHTGGSEFSIYNNSDLGIFIQSIKVTLGVGAGEGAAVFSTFPAAPFLNSGIAITHFGTTDFHVSGVEGSAALGTYDTSILNNEGYTGTLATDISDGDTMVTFNFSDFAPGEAFGIFVDYDVNTPDGLPPTDKDDTTPGGNQLDGTTIDVTFLGALGETETLSMTYSVGGGTGSKSFPTDPVPLNADSTLEPIPIPAAVWLFGSALGLIGYARARRNKSA